MVLEMSVRETLHEIGIEGREEFAEASLMQKGVLGATACSLAFEWGTGNEALIGLVAGNVLRNTHDTLLTAAAGGGASFAEQSVFGLLAAASVHNFPRVMTAARKRLETPSSPEDETGNQATSVSVAKRLGDRFLTAFAIGTSLAVMKNNATKEHTAAENTKNVVIDAGLIGGGVAGVAAIAAGATNLGRSIGLRDEMNVFVDVISSPFTYLGLFSLKSAFDFRRWRANRQPTDADVQA